MRAGFLLVLLGALGAPGPDSELAAQQDQLTRAFDMERRGNYSGAAESYRAVLADPAGRSGRSAGAGASPHRAEPASRDHPPGAGGDRHAPNRHAPSMAWRCGHGPRWTRLDSARKVVDLWARCSRRMKRPYREWANISLSKPRPAGGAANLSPGPGTAAAGMMSLAAEVAQVAMLDEDYRHRGAGMGSRPSSGSRAIAQLPSTPDRRAGSQPPAILQSWSRGEPGSAAAGGESHGALGRPGRRIPAAEPGAPSAPVRRDRDPAPIPRPGATAGYEEAPEGPGHDHEAMAVATNGPGPRATGWKRPGSCRIGRPEAAHRMLSLLAADANSPRSVAPMPAPPWSPCCWTRGKVDEAARELAQQPRDALRRPAPAAESQAGHGMGPATATSIAPTRRWRDDSTVEGFDLAGRLKLFRGDLAAARTMLRSAGPMPAAGTKRPVAPRCSRCCNRSSRTACRSSVAPCCTWSGGTRQRRSSDSSDLAGTAAGRSGRRRAAVAGGPASAGPGPESRKRSDPSGRRRPPRSKATAPAAFLELARLLLAVGRKAESQATLEQLILDHPQSAVTPQARRLLDELRGAVPRT